jgi:Domain of unknown function (DUF5666)
VKTLVMLAVVGALSFGTVALAQTSSAPVPDKGAAAKKPTVRNVSGTVKSTSSETVVVAGRDKGKDAEWTFAVEPTTDIRKGMKSIVATDLKLGDAVQVRFTEQDGKAVARSITVRGKSAATAKKTKS